MPDARGVQRLLLSARLAATLYINSLSHTNGDDQANEQHVCYPPHDSICKCSCSYSLTWEQQGKVPSLGSYYLNTIDALYEVCPGCLYLIEGGGQATYCGVNWYISLSPPPPTFVDMTV